MGKFPRRSIQMGMGIANDEVWRHYSSATKIDIWWNIYGVSPYFIEAAQGLSPPMGSKFRDKATCTS